MRRYRFFALFLFLVVGLLVLLGSSNLKQLRTTVTNFKLSIVEEELISEVVEEPHEDEEDVGAGAAGGGGGGGGSDSAAAVTKTTKESYILDRNPDSGSREKDDSSPKSNPKTKASGVIPLPEVDIFDLTKIKVERSTKGAGYFAPLFSIKGVTRFPNYIVMIYLLDYEETYLAKADNQGDFEFKIAAEQKDKIGKFELLAINSEDLELVDRMLFEQSDETGQYKRVESYSTEDPAISRTITYINIDRPDSIKNDSEAEISLDFVDLDDSGEIEDRIMSFSFVVKDTVTGEDIFSKQDIISLDDVSLYPLKLALSRNLPAGVYDLSLIVEDEDGQKVTSVSTIKVEAVKLVQVSEGEEGYFLVALLIAAVIIGVGGMVLFVRS